MGKIEKLFTCLKNQGVQETSYKVLKYAQREVSFFDVILFHFSFPRLNSRMDIEENLQDVLDSVYNFEGYGPSTNLIPMQVREELEEALERFTEEDIDVIVEIGTAKGGTMYPLVRHLDLETFVSIDLPGGTTPPSFLGKICQKSGTEFIEIRSDSGEQSTFEEVKNKLGEKEADLLFIDGDHRYEAAKRDYEMYSTLVRDDGLIAFHDITMEKGDPQEHVVNLWEDLKLRREDYVEVKKDLKGPVKIGGRRINAHGWGILRKAD